MDHNNLTNLTDLTDTQVLSVLKTRYLRNKIYTYSGYTLVSVNPNTYLPIYGQDVILAYRNENTIGNNAVDLENESNLICGDNGTGINGDGEMMDRHLFYPSTDPHIYALAEHATDILCIHDHVTIVISGESGSGKTVNHNHLLEYLIYRTSDNNMRQDGLISGVKRNDAFIKNHKSECNVIDEDDENYKTNDTHVKNNGRSECNDIDEDDENYVTNDSHVKNNGRSECNVIDEDDENYKTNDTHVKNHSKSECNFIDEDDENYKTNDSHVKNNGRSECNVIDEDNENYKINDTQGINNKKIHKSAIEINNNITTTKHNRNILENCENTDVNNISQDSSICVSINTRLLAINPIMEAFGNATTTLNKNSSRFGKKLDLIFTTAESCDFIIERAFMSVYLLEKSRVTHCGEGECTFHIFYYFIEYYEMWDLYDDNDFISMPLDSYRFNNISVNNDEHTIEYNNNKDKDLGNGMNKNINHGNYNKSTREHANNKDKNLGASNMFTKEHMNNIDNNHNNNNDYTKGYKNNKDKNDSGKNKYTKNDGGNTYYKDHYSTILTNFSLLQIPYKKDIEDILESILILGKIKITEDGNIEPSPFINRLLYLLDLDEETFYDFLLITKLETPVDTLRLKNDNPKCIEIKNSFARSLYDEMFGWLVGIFNNRLGGFTDINNETDKSNLKYHSYDKFKCINEDCQNGEFIGKKKITVLDIYGFEVFENNKFDQFCINWANEKIQDDFVNRMFVDMNKLYKEEGIDLEMDFKLNMYDNRNQSKFQKNSSNIKDKEYRGTLDLLEKRCGIVDLINEESIKPGGSIKNFLLRMEGMNGVKVSGNGFSLGHYASDVYYDVEGFMEKNNESMIDYKILYKNRYEDYKNESIYSSEGSLIKDIKSNIVNYQMHKSSIDNVNYVIKGDGSNIVDNHVHKNSYGNTIENDDNKKIDNQTNKYSIINLSNSTEYKSKKGNFMHNEFIEHVPELHSSINKHKNKNEINIILHHIITTSQRKKKNTILKGFKTSLNELFNSFLESKVLYVRCIKPCDNNAKDRNTNPNFVNYFDEKYVMRQLKGCGVMETIEISKKTYSHHLYYEEFNDRYNIVLRKYDINNTEYKNYIVNEDVSSDESNLMEIRETIIKNIRYGKTRIFLTNNVLNILEKERKEIIDMCKELIGKSILEYHKKLMLEKSMYLISEYIIGFYKTYKETEEIKRLNKIEEINRLKQIEEMARLKEVREIMRLKEIEEIKSKNKGEEINRIQEMIDTESKYDLEESKSKYYAEEVESSKEVEGKKTKNEGKSLETSKEHKEMKGVEIPKERECIKDEHKKIEDNKLLKNSVNFITNNANIKDCIDKTNLNTDKEKNDNPMNYRNICIDENERMKSNKEIQIYNDKNIYDSNYHTNQKYCNPDEDLLDDNLAFDCKDINLIGYDSLYKLKKEKVSMEDKGKKNAENINNDYQNHTNGKIKNNQGNNSNTNGIHSNLNDSKYYSHANSVSTDNHSELQSLNRCINGLKTSPSMKENTFVTFDKYLLSKNSEKGYKLNSIHFKNINHTKNEEVQTPNMQNNSDYEKRIKELEEKVRNYEKFCKAPCRNCKTMEIKYKYQTEELKRKKIRDMEMENYKNKIAILEKEMLSLKTNTNKKEVNQKNNIKEDTTNDVPGDIISDEALNNAKNKNENINNDIKDKFKTQKKIISLQNSPRIDIKINNKMKNKFDVLRTDDFTISFTSPYDVFGCLLELFLEFAPTLNTSSTYLPKDEATSMAHILFHTVLKIKSKSVKSLKELIEIITGQVRERFEVFERDNEKVCFIISNMIEMKGIITEMYDDNKNITSEESKLSSENINFRSKKDFKGVINQMNVNIKGEEIKGIVSDSINNDHVINSICYGKDKDLNKNMNNRVRPKENYNMIKSIYNSKDDCGNNNKDLNDGNNNKEIMVNSMNSVNNKDNLNTMNTLHVNKDKNLNDDDNNCENGNNINSVHNTKDRNMNDGNKNSENDNNSVYNTKDRNMNDGNKNMINSENDINSVHNTKDRNMNDGNKNSENDNNSVYNTKDRNMNDGNKNMINSENDINSVHNTKDRNMNDGNKNSENDNNSVYNTKDRNMNDGNKNMINSENDNNSVYNTKDRNMNDGNKNMINSENDNNSVYNTKDRNMNDGNVINLNGNMMNSAYNGKNRNTNDSSYCVKNNIIDKNSNDNFLFNKNENYMNHDTKEQFLENDKLLKNDYIEIIGDLDDLINVLFSHLCEMLKKNLLPLLPEAIIEHQGIKEFYCKPKSSIPFITSKFSFSPFRKQKTIQMLIDVLEYSISILLHYHLPERYWEECIDYLLKTINSRSFNGIMVKNDFLSFKRGIQINNNINTIEKFLREINYCKGIHCLEHIRSIVKLINYIRVGMEMNNLMDEIPILNSMQIMELISKFVKEERECIGIWEIKQNKNTINEKKINKKDTSNKKELPVYNENTEKNTKVEWNKMEKFIGDGKIEIKNNKNEKIKFSVIVPRFIPRLRKTLELISLERRRGIDEDLPEEEIVKTIDEVCSKDCITQSA